jgi:hypothetical protein
LLRHDGAFNLIDPTGLLAATGERLHFMASLYAYFDESGKFKDHKIVSFCGFVADFQQSEAFAGDWRYLLRRNDRSTQRGI